MSSVKAVRCSLAPWLLVRHAGRAVDFYRTAFSAQAVYRIEDPLGNVVARLSVGESEFWVSDESPRHGNPSPDTVGGTSVKLLLTVPDPDTAFARAIAAGASQVYEVQEGHGWRVGRIVDPFGHHWEIGRPLEPDAAADEAADASRPGG
jgi:PhnB protein